jgi:hypothetical protein
VISLPAPPARSGTSIALVLGLVTFGLAVLVVIAAAVAVVVLGLGAGPQSAASASGSGAAPALASVASAPPPSASADDPTPDKTARTTRPKAPTSAVPTASSTAPSGSSACVQACNRVRACAPGTACDSSGCTGWKLALANCINNAGSCSQATKCLP